MKAVFIGRFQPFHNGHLYALKKIAKNYDEIFIVIGSADKGFEKENPFTAEERKEMLKSVLAGLKIKAKIIPVDDVENDELWLAGILDKIRKIDAVFSNNSWVRRIFEHAGYRVESTGRYKRGVYEGKQIRRLMSEGKKWERCVPAEVVRYIEKINGAERINKLFK